MRVRVSRYVPSRPSDFSRWKPFFLADATRLSLVSLEDIRFDKGRPFRGVVRAGRDVKLERNAIFEGVLVAGRKIDVKRDSRITFLAPDRSRR